MIKYPKGALKTTAEIAALLAEGKSTYLVVRKELPVKLTFDFGEPIVELFSLADMKRKFLNYCDEKKDGRYYLWALGLDDEKPPSVFNADDFQPTEFVFGNYWDAFAYACKMKKVA